MSTTYEKWEELGLSNDFLFGKVMQDPALCQELLQMILPNIKIDHIEYVQPQKAIRPDIDAKSVRLDVYVKDDEHTVYDIEMQCVDTKELPKRTRYYQSTIDLEMLDKNNDYKVLNKSFVIFICLSDIFGRGRHIYTFENRCIQDPDLSLGDGTTKIFLNTEGTMNDVSPKMKAFLDYVAGRDSNDTFVEKLKSAVSRAKVRRDWRREYMTLQMKYLEKFEKGRAEGRAEGREEGRKSTLEIMRALRNGSSEEELIQKGYSHEEIQDVQNALKNDR